MEANIKQANAVFIQRYATAQEWTLNNPIIYPGEIGIESDTGKIKVGSTVARQWRELDYNTSDGGQVIDNLDIIYNNPSALPTTGNYDGKQLIAKTNGELPMSVYRWVASLRSWINIGVVKETVVYFAKKKGNSTNILCFYDHNTKTFISTEQQKEITITDIDTIVIGTDALKTIVNQKDGDIYIVFNNDLQVYFLYQYQASALSWRQIAILNEQTIYTNTNFSKNYNAPELSLWKVKITGSTLKFIRLGWDENFAKQLEGLSEALTELHNYAQVYIGGNI